MSVHDSYEVRRGPVRRKRYIPKQKPRREEHQLAMKLFGGATKQEIKSGQPFDDPLTF